MGPTISSEDLAKKLMIGDRVQIVNPKDCPDLGAGGGKVVICTNEQPCLFHILWDVGKSLHYQAGMSCLFNKNYSVDKSWSIFIPEI